MPSSEPPTNDGRAPAAKMPSAGICVATAGGPYAWIIINALGEAFGPIDVILEAPEPRGAFLKCRNTTRPNSQSSLRKSRSD